MTVYKCIFYNMTGYMGVILQYDCIQVELFHNISTIKLHEKDIIPNN